VGSHGRFFGNGSPTPATFVATFVPDFRKIRKETLTNYRNRRTILVSVHNDARKAFSSFQRFAMQSVSPQIVAKITRSSRSLLLRGWVVAVALLMMGGVSTDAFAKCGSSSRQMIWRTGSTSDLLVWDGGTARQEYASSSPFSGMNSSEHGEGECTRCRCRKDSERPLFPDLDWAKTVQQPVVSTLDLHCSEGVDPATGSIAVSDTTFFGRSLGCFERPPRDC